MADLTLYAAHGRSYANPEVAQADWVGGKDFLIAEGPDEGRYCSVRDTQALANTYDAIIIRLSAWPHTYRIKLPDPETEH